MSQRIMTGVSAVMAVCCIAVVGFAWSMMKESQLVNHQMLEQLTLIADRPQPVATNEVDQQILKQLEQLNQKQETQSASANNEMCQISFDLIKAGSEKKPAVEFKGKLIKSGDQTDSFMVEAESDESGKLNFGKLPWGKYSLRLQAPWGEHNSNWESSGIGMVMGFTTIPGRDYLKTIVCPAAAPEEVPVQIKVNWPAELKSDDYFLLCDFREIPSPSNPAPFHLKSAREIQNDTWYYVRNDKQNMAGVYLLNKRNEICQCPLNEKGEFIDLTLITLKENSSIKLSCGSYFLYCIYLFEKSDLSKLSEINRHEFNPILDMKTQQITTYTRTLYDNTGFNATSMFIVPFKNKTQLLNPDDPMKNIVKSNEADGIVLPNQIRFTASKNEKNIWEINLPDLELLKIPEGVQEGHGGALGGRNGAGQGLF